jgi:predicted dehydrogenase
VKVIPPFAVSQFDISITSQIMNNLRVAVVGAGRLGGFHAQKLAARNDAELVAVVDPLAENCRRVAEQCKCQSLADYRGLLDKIDAAVIAAPTSLHYEIAREFLEAGIHLLVEKPLCASFGEANELVSLAQRRGLALQVGHIERFNPVFQAAARELRRPKYIEALRAGPPTFRSMDIGVVLDLMIHDIDLVLSLVGGPLRKVDALGISVLGGHEDAANARLEFACGCVATLSASRIAAEPARRMQLWSAEGMATLDFAARTATITTPSETLRRRQFDARRLTPEQIEHHCRHFSEEHLPRRQLNYAAVDALVLEQDDFIESIRQGRRPMVDGVAGRDALAVAARILDCIDAHRWSSEAAGPTGPLALPRPRLLPAAAPLKKAG